MADLTVVQDLIDLVAGIGLPSTLIVYLRDRQKNRASGRVAEGTVFADIQTRGTAALDAHVAYVEKAFDTERNSMKRQIDGLQAEVKELQRQVAERDALIESLREQVGALTDQMNSLQNQINKIPSKLPPPHPPHRKSP